MEMANMSVEEIKAQIAAHEAQIEAAKAAIEEAKMAAVGRVAEQIAELLDQEGVEYEELFEFFGYVKDLPARSVRKRKDIAATARATYRDKATGSIYRGGKMPIWLQDAMSKAGMAYKEYRDTRMERIVA